MIVLCQCKYFSHSLNIYINDVVIKKICNSCPLPVDIIFSHLKWRLTVSTSCSQSQRRSGNDSCSCFLYGGYTTWKNWHWLLSISVKQIIHLIILWVLVQHWKILSMNSIWRESLLPCQRLQGAGIWLGLQGALINWAKITGKFVLSKWWKLNFLTVLKAQSNFKLTARYVLKIFVWHVI